MLDFNKAFSSAAKYAKKKQFKERIKTMKELVSCEGKVSFDTFTAASQVAKQRRKEVKFKRRPYRCFFCQHYHIG